MSQPSLATDHSQFADFVAKVPANEAVNGDHEGDAQALVRIWNEITRLGLERNVAELEAHGYTVVEPELAAPVGLAEAALERILSLSQERRGVAPDLVDGSSHGTSDIQRDMPVIGRGETLYALLFADPVFERLLMTEVQLALVTYLLGEHCLLSGMSASIKGPGGLPVPLHTDQHSPEPFPSFAQTANATWALTDYTVENGCLTMVPGSHREGRHPRSGEGVGQAVPVEMPRGSLIVWHGNQWHGAFPRTAPGLRVNLLQYFCRPYMQTFERRGVLDDELRERNPPRMSTLLGDFLQFGYDAEGPRGPELGRMLQICHSRNQ